MDNQTESPPEVLPKNSIFLDMRLASGQLSTAPSSSLLHLIDRRERGLGADGFTKPQRYAIRNMHVPNGCSRIQSNDSSRQCIALSDTGNHFLTVSEYEDDSQTVEVALYDASRDTYRLIKRTTEFRDAHDFGLSKAAFSSKGNEFVYTTNPDRLFVGHVDDDWSLGDNVDDRCIPAYGIHNNASYIFSVAFSGCADYIIGGMRYGRVRLYDRRGDKDCDWSAHGEPYDVHTAGFLPGSSDIMFTGCDDGGIRIWDRRFGKLQSRGMVSETTGHAGHSVSHIDVKMDCNYLISKATDDSIKLWDLRWFTSTKEDSKTDKSLMTYRGHFNKRNYDMLLEAKFSPVETGQRYIYTGTTSGHLFVYDLLTGDIVWTTNEGHPDMICHVCWHPQRQEILTSSMRRAITESAVHLHRYTEADNDHANELYLF